MRDAENFVVPISLACCKQQQFSFPNICYNRRRCSSIMLRLFIPAAISSVCYSCDGFENEKIRLKESLIVLLGEDEV